MEAYVWFCRRASLCLVAYAIVVSLVCVWCSAEKKNLFHAGEQPLLLFSATTLPTTGRACIQQYLHCFVKTHGEQLFHLLSFRRLPRKRECQCGFVSKLTARQWKEADKAETSTSDCVDKYRGRHDAAWAVLAWGKGSKLLISC